MHDFGEKNEKWFFLLISVNTSTSLKLEMYKSKVHLKIEKNLFTSVFKRSYHKQVDDISERVHQRYAR